MKKVQTQEETIARLLKDPGFSKRTASSVIKKAENVKPGNTIRYLAAAAALVVFAGVFWIANRPEVTPRYAGLTSSSVEMIVTQNETAWEDTDAVIDNSIDGSIESW